MYVRSEAYAHELPHQVQINYNNNHLCSGSILATYLILTAAHCLTNKKVKEIQVVAGEHELSQRSDAEQRRGIKEAIVHPKFNSSEGGYVKGYDIALLVLDTELVFNDEIKSILIPSSRSVFSDSAIVSGWGMNPDKDLYGSSDVLRVGNVRIKSKSACSKDWINNDLFSTQLLCAGGNLVDACKGDSGGPLTCWDNVDHEKQYACGIVSYGVRCDGRGVDRAGLYTDVAYFHDWIIEVTVNIRSMYNCPPNYFRCRNGMCVPNEYVCDGHQDCLDGSDEGVRRFKRSLALKSVKKVGIKKKRRPKTIMRKMQELYKSRPRTPPHVKPTTTSNTHKMDSKLSYEFTCPLTTTPPL